jgi:hypothetical protein
MKYPMIGEAITDNEYIYDALKNKENYQFLAAQSGIKQ